MPHNRCTVILLFIFYVVYSVKCNPDEIKSLPGLQDPINFRHYSGYLNASSGKYLHYWFVESQHSPENDPLVLWLNGGPGCSSMEGMLKELGPLLINNDGKTLRLNDYSWNKVANVLFLEAPAGVGFSYSDSGNYTTDDDTTANDNYLALQSFFKKFPQFQRNDFYITGESYGGIYIPTLSVLVMNGIADINFKGFAIGNGFLDGDRLGKSIIFFAYEHGLMDVIHWEGITNSCCQGTPLRRTCQFSNPPNEQCRKLVDQVLNIIDNAGLNIYNLYDDCASLSSRGISRDVIDKRNLLKQFPWSRITHLLKQGSLDPPCTDSTSLTKYLNRDEVRLALHIPPIVQEWDICSDYVSAHYVRQYSSMKDQVMSLLSGGIRGLIYNGDVDMACNFLGDQWFVEDLGLPVIEDYRPWKFDKQIAGFVKTFKSLVLLTIKGSGHMVPQDKPGPAFKMISSFLFNKPY